MSRTITVSGGPSAFLQNISVGPHHLVSDEPKDAGGNDAGPNPYELLLAALGACTSMTLRMYAERKGWHLNDVRVELTHSRSHAEDCAGCDKNVTWVDRIEREITLTGELPPEQRQRLLDIANRCPVHRTLLSKMQIETRLVENRT